MTEQSDGIGVIDGPPARLSSGEAVAMIDIKAAKRMIKVFMSSDVCGVVFSSL